MFEIYHHTYQCFVRSLEQGLSVKVSDYESKVEFIGVAQCKDGAIKVVYREKDETSPRVVSVRGKLLNLISYLLISFESK